MSIEQLQKTINRLDNQRGGSCDLDQLAQMLIEQCQLAKAGHPAVVESEVSALHISLVLHALYEFYAYLHENELATRRKPSWGQDFLDGRPD